MNLKPAILNVTILAGLVLVFNVLLYPNNWAASLKYSQKFLRFEQHNDSWRPMGRALDYLQNKTNTELIYTEIFFHQKNKFQYPLTSLLFPAVFSLIWVDYIAILKMITWLSAVGTLLFCILIFIRTTNHQWRFNTETLMVISSLGLLWLLFYPVMKAYNLGQIQAWLNFIFAALLYCWLRGWENASGILLGVMCLIKPQYLVVALWGVLRKRWSFVLTCSLVFVFGTLISVSVFGFENNLNYLSVLSFLSKHGESFYPNQSMNGLLNRLFFNGTILEWNGSEFPPFSKKVYLGTTLFGIVLILFAFITPKLIRKEGSAIDLSIMAITATMASPIAWEHHYGILLPIYVLIFCLISNLKNNHYFIPLIISYAVCSNYFPAINNYYAQLPGWNVLLSYLFFGALILLIVLYGLLFDKDAPIDERT